jgi:predicted Zn finger-like uncharacterized protein
MILSCPACHTRYFVDEAEFAEGPRTVRCSRCTHSWLAVMPSEPVRDLVEQILAVPLDAPEKLAVGKASTAPLNLTRRETKYFWHRDWMSAGILVGSALVLLLLLLGRTIVAQIFPSTEGIYNSIGLHIYHLGEGLSLQQVRSEMQFEGGMTMLTINGVIHNETDKPQPVPNILAAAIGPDGKIMQSWQIDAPKAIVEPGQDIPLSSEIRAPKGAVVEITMNFIEPKP